MLMSEIEPRRAFVADGASWVADLLLPPVRAVAMLPQVELSERQLEDVRHGRPVRWPDAIRGLEEKTEAEEVAAVDAVGRLAAILAPRGKGWLGPRRVLE